MQRLALPPETTVTTNLLPFFTTLTARPPAARSAARLALDALATRTTGKAEPASGVASVVRLARTVDCVMDAIGAAEARTPAVLVPIARQINAISCFLNLLTSRVCRFRAGPCIIAHEHVMNIKSHASKPRKAGKILRRSPICFQGIDRCVRIGNAKCDTAKQHPVL